MKITDKSRNMSLRRILLKDKKPHPLQDNIKMHLTQAYSENSWTIHSIIFVHLRAFSYCVHSIASNHKIITNEKVKGERKHSWPILMFAYTSPGHLHGETEESYNTLSPSQFQRVSYQPQSVEPPLVSDPQTVYVTNSQLPSISAGRLHHPQPEDAPCCGTKNLTNINSLLIRTLHV